MQHGGNSGYINLLSKLRLKLSHGEFSGLAVLVGEIDRDKSGFQVQGDAVHFMAEDFSLDHPGRAQGGMSGKRQFSFRSENAHFVSAVSFVFGKNEGGFRKIELTGYLLHLVVAVALSVADYSELVAGVTLFGEDIKYVKFCHCYIHLYVGAVGRLDPAVTVSVVQSRQAETPDDTSASDATQLINGPQTGLEHPL